MAKPDTVERPTFGGIALIALPSFLWLLADFVLPPPPPIDPQPFLLDPSWQIFITNAFLSGMRFGQDLIYNYGPWGFLHSARGDPQIYPWLLGGRLLLAVAFAAGVALLARRKLRNGIARHVFTLSVTVLSDPMLVLPIVLLAVVLSQKDESSGRNPIRDILAIACGLLIWIKFTMFVAVLALVAVLGIQDLIRRRWPRVSGIVLVSALAFWLLARQSISGLGPFVYGSLSMAMSYSSAMYVQGALWHVVVAAVLVIASALPCAAQFSRQKIWFLWPSALWVAALFFLHFKEAFVRHDLAHVWGGTVTGILPCGLILLCLAGAFRAKQADSPGIRILNRACAVAVILIGVALPLLILTSHGGKELIANLRDEHPSVMTLVGGPGMRERYESELNRFQREKPLTPVPGTASFFPDTLALLYGNRFPVRFPPVPQAFTAYNPYLSGRNESFYRSAHRPDFIFFEIAPLDERFPTSLDGLSLAAFLDCYSPSGTSGRYLILAASGCANAFPELLSQVTTPIADPITVPEVPPGYAIWVQFSIRLNAAGSLVALLSHPPTIQLGVTTGAGQKLFRIAAEAGKTGFILSPLLAETASFSRLYAGSSDHSDDVRRIQFLIGGYGQRMYQPTVDLRFFRLRLPVRHAATGVPPVPVSLENPGAVSLK